MVQSQRMAQMHQLALNISSCVAAGGGGGGGGGGGVLWRCKHTTKAIMASFVRIQLNNHSITIVVILTERAVGGGGGGGGGGNNGKW